MEPDDDREARQSADLGLGGEIYLDLTRPPPPISDEDFESIEEWDGPGPPPPVLDEEVRTLKDGTLYARRLARWKDLSTIKTKTKCVRYMRVGSLKSCIGWKTTATVVQNTAYVTVKTKTPQKIEEAVEQCLAVTAVAAAVAALASGGSAAVKAAEAVFEVCLSQKLSDIVSVRVPVTPRRVRA